ncbi:MAG: hypothetical protein J6U66_02785 [Lachnospiraceae bacterium]|nr:hypothetical protein [Lachnospiraceae bacterium]
MKTNGWGKEPFDLRLVVLRTVRSLPGILLATALLTLLFGGGYYLKNITFRQPSYVASSTFFVEYTDENWFVDNMFISDYTWNEWLDTDEFQGFVLEHLEGAAPKGNLDDVMSAEVAYDLRLVTILVRSGDADEANRISKATQPAITEDFTNGVRDVASIRVTDFNAAAENLKNVKPVRAAVLSAVCSLLAVLIAFLLKELIFEKVWLPDTIKNRFGIRCAGAPTESTFAENVKYFFQGQKRIAVCPTGASMDPKEVVAELSKISSDQEWIPMPSPELSPESAEKLREMDGILLVTQAGEDVKHLQGMVSFLEGQDVTVTAAALWNEDAWLLRLYGLGMKKEAAATKEG